MRKVYLAISCAHATSRFVRLFLRRYLHQAGDLVLSSPGGELVHAPSPRAARYR